MGVTVTEQNTFQIEDVVRNQLDDTGSPILKVYAKAPPYYAVYGTDERVKVQYSNSDAEAAAQRKGLAPLNGVRSQIDGLIDGWRKSNRFKGKAARYDARVATSLILCLEGDPTNALASLNDIKRDINEERISWARFEYLIAASAFSLLLLLIVLIACFFFSRGPLLTALWLAATGGVIGAFFSIALAISNRTVLTNLRQRDNYCDAVLRITIGLLASLVLILLMRANLLKDFKINDVALSGTKITTEAILILGFVGGFLERLVPDMLAKAASAAGADTTNPTLPAMPASGTQPKLVGADRQATTPSADNTQDNSVASGDVAGAEVCDVAGTQSAQSNASATTADPATGPFGAGAPFLGGAGGEQAQVAGAAGTGGPTLTAASSEAGSGGTSSVDTTGASSTAAVPASGSSPA
jgi:hypothetical protein